MGLFGIGEIFSTLEGKVKAELVTSKITHLWPTLKDWAISKWSILRGSGVGFLVACCRGRSGDCFSPVLCSGKEGFQATGEIRPGGAGGGGRAESANNAAASASFIPMLTLGIPGNPAIAMIFAALLIQGVTPGPLLIKDHPSCSGR